MIQQIQREDPGVTSYEFLDTKRKQIKDIEGIKIMPALEAPLDTYYLKLNDKTFSFVVPTRDVLWEYEKYKIPDYLTSQSPESITRHYQNSHFLSNFKLFIDSSQKEKIDQQELARIIQDSLDVFDETLADKQLFNLYARKLQLKSNIHSLYAAIDKSLNNGKSSLEESIALNVEEYISKLDRKAQRRTNILFSTIFASFFTEFLLGYYCIYHVEWLGWDLVEPVTYTLGQGKFVLGTWFFWKYLSDTSWTDLNSFFTNRYSTNFG